MESNSQTPNRHVVELKTEAKRIKIISVCSRATSHWSSAEGLLVVSTGCTTITHAFQCCMKKYKLEAYPPELEHLIVDTNLEKHKIAETATHFSHTFTQVILAPIGVSFR